MQLSCSHIYIIVQLAAWTGQLGVLIHQPVERNAILFPTLSLPSYMNLQSFKSGLFGLDYCPKAQLSEQRKGFISLLKHF